VSNGPAIEGTVIGWAIAGILLGSALVCYLRSEHDKEQKRLAEEKAQEAERKKREHEAWLQTPEGMVWQKEERERIRRQQEEEERRRRAAEEPAARARWTQYHESKTLEEVDRMSGSEFEEFLARLFSRMGYTDISLTPTHDQGADLLCRSPSGTRVAIQAKRWQGRVGNAAVQEVHSAVGFYDCAEGMVVTNSTFTDAARELAEKHRIALCDGRWLEEQIKRFLPRETPDFSWEEYNRVVKDRQPPRAGRGRNCRSRRYWRGRRR
jgi:restriction endonuclease Mrr